MSDDPGGPPTGGGRLTGLLLPVASAAQAVRVAAVLGLAADAVPSSRGVLLLPRGGGGVDDAVVTRVSRSLRRADVLVLTRADEQVSVQRWRAGRLVDTPHYGVVGGVDGDAERVLLGRLPAAQAQGATSTDGVDPREAAREVVAAVRGPVRPWQLVLSGLLLVLSALLAVAGALDLAAGRAQGALDAAVPLLWAALAVYWALSLRGLLRRRARERAGGAPA
ncbi:MAG: hypothetical protein AVDCRST_MAG35-1288 [uncultured Quadrisphaera sp.]|uniref:Uncharacterized protein n=1 Tax=uncultured Quadrisphaera sp. TaxID=904978 RepID=A0A6J4P7T4_9ACTN|nr:MAG: hypothetical protein AVDCRST_MAG35-1288 [uncultured Quadrisphaera sp.]